MSWASIGRVQLPPDESKRTTIRKSLGCCRAIWPVEKISRKIYLSRCTKSPFGLKTCQRGSVTSKTTNGDFQPSTPSSVTIRRFDRTRCCSTTDEELAGHRSAAGFGRSAPEAGECASSVIVPRVGLPQANQTRTWFICVPAAYKR